LRRAEEIARPQLPGRYRSLDAWRGIAALWVAFYHLWPHDGFLAALVRPGWLGVHLFFPISGYCIMAAIHSPANATFVGFMRRRWRRIFPPYWASIALAVLLALLSWPINTGAIADFRLTAGGWLSVFTLTQGLFHLEKAVNEVYWTLCYEEQFYLVVALCLLGRARLRPWLLLGVCAIAFYYRGPHWPHRWGGLFLDRWLEFAAGMAVFAWRHPAYGRWWGPVVFAGALASWRESHDEGMLLAIGFAALLLVLQPLDARFIAARWSRPLQALGLISFSLYLIHVPLGGRLRYVMSNMHPTVEGHVVSAISIAVSIYAATFFYRYVEERYKSPRQRRLPAAAEMN
jgi:peptidoglycan/LPS O-acetylase OafA/YrhL